MKFGYVSMNSAAGIRPAPLAKELESRGFESFWVPEHTHIPTSRLSPYPSGGDLPSGYYHMMSPFVSLAAASAVTTELKLGTAVALLLQHDPVDLAKQVSTLDAISGGRVLLGVGVGWNAEELADHLPDLPFNHRYGAMKDRVEALRQLWTNSEAGVDGRYDKVSPSAMFPKPVAGTVPVYLGNWGPLGVRHAAEYADAWMPIDHHLKGDDGRPDVAMWVDKFRRMVAEAGRNPEDVPISLMLFGRPTAARIERYAALGIERLALSGPSAEVVDADFTLRDLDDVTPIISPYMD